MAAEIERLRDRLKKVGNLLIGGHHAEALGEIMKEFDHAE